MAELTRETAGNEPGGDEGNSMQAIAMQIADSLRPHFDAIHEKIKKLHDDHFDLKWNDRYRSAGEEKAGSMLAHCCKIIRPVLAAQGHISPDASDGEVAKHLHDMLRHEHENGRHPYEAAERYALASGWKHGDQPEEDGDTTPGEDPEEKPEETQQEEDANTPDPKEPEEEEADDPKTRQARERTKSIRGSTAGNAPRRLEDYSGAELAALRQTKPEALAALFAEASNRGRK